MPILVYISWACYAAAALCVMAILSTESLVYLAPAISAAVAGVVFAAMERIIDTLIEIRDAVVPVSDKDLEGRKMADNKAASMVPPTQTSPIGLAELEEKIQRLKKHD